MFNFPRAARPDGNHFGKNLLQSIIFQVKFSTNRAIIEKKDELSKFFQSRFPIQKPVVSGQISIQITDKTPLLQSESRSAGIELRTADNSKVLVITEDAVTFTCLGKAYSSFEKIFPEAWDCFSHVFSEAGIISGTRSAIRKINMLEFESTESTPRAYVLPMVFNKALIDNILSIPCSDSIESGTTTFSAHKNPYKLNCTYGLLGRNSPSGKGQIVLDIDLFSEDTTQVIGELDRTFTAINDEIFNIFIWALAPQMMTVLQPQTGGGSLQ